MNLLLIGQRWNATFHSPLKQLKALMPELKELRSNLQRFDLNPDPLSTIVYFFDEVSKWHDRGIDELIWAFIDANYGQFDTAIDKMETLQIHFQKAGRERYGWNRTEKGEVVTEDRVFLGNIYGLFTHPVFVWKKGKDEKKGFWGYPGMEHLNAYDVVTTQAKGFMDSHIKSMISIIDYLERLVV